jgi:uncharacterized protein
MPFWKSKTVERVVEAAKKGLGFFASEPTVSPREVRPGRIMLNRLREQTLNLAPIRAQPGAMDGSHTTQTIKGAYGESEVNFADALLGWFLSQGFIGHQIAAYVATHWLIDKCCSMPARDAIRQGYRIVSDEGKDLDSEVQQAFKKYDELFAVNRNMKQFVHMGRVFGVRVALFRVESTDPSYYEHPFNPDGITPGSYKGIVQVDPYWCSPELDTRAASDPSSPHFYEPTWWRINGKRYHRTHLVIFRNGEVSDLLKPQYLYGGVPVPQRILERVYAAERTANEAPQLAMTKRSTVFGTDVAEAFANKDAFDSRLADWAYYRDNYAIKVLDKANDEIQQFDTSLTDLDAVIMTQYQIVAAAAGVPATKLLGTTPKGFNATGESEESSYHEELESIQTHDLTPFLERHHLLVMRSFIAPKLLAGVPIDTSAVWEPLDSPTAKEEAEINKQKADSDKALVDAGAIDGLDIRKRLSEDRQSGYYGMEIDAPLEPVEDPAAVATPPGDPGAPPAPTPGLAQPGAVAGDANDTVRLVTNQQHIDPEIVAAKTAARDFNVQVSPLFTDEHGSRFRIIIDGHHSYAAAVLAGVAPTLIEGDYTGSDYHVVNGPAILAE